MQPPSGGCVLKRFLTRKLRKLKSSHLRVAVCWNLQRNIIFLTICLAATFGWLCVETKGSRRNLWNGQAATFGWLCVETLGANKEESSVIGSHLRVAVCWNLFIAILKMWQWPAATFGWLCVETENLNHKVNIKQRSHLRVAVCWNFIPPFYIS